MKNFKSPLLAAVAGALTLAMVPTAAQAQTNPAPTVPIEVWALRDVVTNVQISPSGKHLLVMKLESKEGEYIMEIYETSDLSKPMRRLNSSPMEIISAQWVSDNYIFGTAWQVKRKTVKRPEQDVRSYRTYAYNLESNKFAQIDGNFQRVNNLPNSPDEILIASGNSVDGGATGVDPFTAFRPRSYYRFNLESGTQSLVLKGNEKFPRASFDNEGNPRFTIGFDRATNEASYYFRKPGDSSWTEFGERYDQDDHANLYRFLGAPYGLAGFNAEDPSKGYVIDNRGADKAALWEFDFDTGEFGEKLFENDRADVLGIQTSSMEWAGDTKMVAAIYSGAKYERHWFDAEEKALFENLEQEIPHAHQVSISSRSRDGNTMIVQNRGPRDPGSFWLVRDGQMAKLGSRNPLLKPEQLSDVEFIQYPARDGMMIPAYVTKPKGEGPHPLIVLPHGGPHVNEVIAYDEWGQLLANAGYMVLQPQYRMSVGWGKKLFDGGYGEHGGKMQDDKDDGALHLVEKGWVDPDRMAMFGWSYGGYAALVAASREEQIYQCVIAGAAVADPEKVYKMRSGPNTPKAIDDWAQRRGMIGINPIKEVDKVNVPVFMVHGDVDARVMYFNYKDYKNEFEKAGKLNPRVTVGDPDTPAKASSEQNGEATANSAGASTAAAQKANFVPKHRFVTLEGADHFSRTLMYNHQEKLYSEMLDFLAKDCGPGGL